MKNSYLYSALVAAVSISVAQAESKPPEQSRVKCYGIAEAGGGDCSGTLPDGTEHSCPGTATEDRDPFAWLYTTLEECKKQGGKLSPPPLPPKKPEVAD